MKAIAFILITVFASATSLLCALSVENLQVSYEAAVLKTNESRDKKIATLRQQYVGALNKLQELAQKRADLQEALAIQNEVGLISKKVWPLPPVPKEFSRTIKRPRQTYLKSRMGIERDWALTTAKLADKMEEALESEVNSLTKAGKLKEAQSAQKLIEKILKDPEILKARELPERLTVTGRARSAYRLRRTGDNVEVLVRYDSDGKVSLNSKVENVVEKTGSKKEKGKTAANTLGEFVGSDDFDSEIIPLFTHRLADGKLPFSPHSGLKIRFQPKEGTLVTIAPDAKEVFLELKGIMKALTDSTNYRITCEVKIPAENKGVKGMTFRHGTSKGTNIGNSIEGNGDWQTVTQTGVGGAMIDVFRIYFTGFKYGEFVKTRGDSVLIRSIKIEQIASSARIVEAFGPSGEIIQEEKNENRQELLISNGTLLKQ